MNNRERIKEINNSDFKRLTGTGKETVLKTAEEVIKHEKERKKVSGRPVKQKFYYSGKKETYSQDTVSYKCGYL